MSRLWPSSGRRRPCGALDERSSSSYRHIHAHDGAHHKTGQESEPITKQFGFAVTRASATPQPRNIQPRLSMAKSALLRGCLRLLRSNPKIEIDLQIVVRYEIELTSSERSFDVGITALPLKHASVHTEPLLDVPAAAIMRRDHPLARRSFVRLSELAGQPLVATPPGTHLRQEVESLFAAEGFEFRPQLTVSNVDIACHIALQAGAIIISDPLIPLTLNAEAYAVVPLKPVRVLQVGIVTPALNPDSRLTTLFKLCLREEAKSIKERFTHRFGNLNAPRNREATLRTAKPRDRMRSSKS